MCWGWQGISKFGKFDHVYCRFAFLALKVASQAFTWKISICSAKINHVFRCSLSRELATGRARLRTALRGAASQLQVTEPERVAQGGLCVQAWKSELKSSPGPAILLDMAQDESLPCNRFSMQAVLLRVTPFNSLPCIVLRLALNPIPTRGGGGHIVPPPPTCILWWNSQTAQNFGKWLLDFFFLLICNRKNFFQPSGGWLCCHRNAENLALFFEKKRLQIAPLLQ